MKYNNLKIVFYFFLFGSALNLQAQTTFKVTYFVSEIKTQGSVENLDNETKLLFMQMVDFTKNIDYILTTNAKESYFESRKVLTKGDDSPLSNILAASAERFTSFNEKVYTNHKKDSIIFVRSILNKDFTVKRIMFNFNWELKNETKQILGFNAKKAEGSYLHPVLNKELKVEAWFIPEIALQSGPDIYTGLPGLIAEVHLKGATVTAKHIESNTNANIKNIEASKIMTQKEFENMVKGLNEKFKDYFSN